MSELEALADLMENWALPGIFCLVRWPYWPLWKRTHGGHESLYFSELGRLFFDWLCVGGLASQAFCAYYFVGQQLYYHYIVDKTGALLSLTAFSALTLVRIGVYLHGELKT